MGFTHCHGHRENKNFLVMSFWCFGACIPLEIERGWGCMGEEIKRIW